MALPRLFLASVLIVGLLGIVSADYRKGQSLKPQVPSGYEQKPQHDSPADYKKGRSLKPYAPPGYQQTHNDLAATKIQGLIYCKKEGKLIPMPGASARVACLALSSLGKYEPFEVVAPFTDDKGYFHINLAKYQIENHVLSHCKVFLEAPAAGICNVPTDINHGLSGAPLGLCRPLGNHSILCSVKPFVFLPTLPTQY